MSKQINVEELAALSGGWESLAKKLWQHTSEPERLRAIKRIVPKADLTEAERFQWSTMQASRRGPKVKYNLFGLGAVYLALDYMQLHDIGNTNRTGRAKLLVAYVNDPKGCRITGLPQSIREMLTDEYAYNIVPESDTPDDIATYLKYLDAKRPAYERVRKLAAEFSDDLSAFADYDNYEGD